MADTGGNTGAQGDKEVFKATGSYHECLGRWNSSPEAATEGGANGSSGAEGGLSLVEKESESSAIVRTTLKRKAEDDEQQDLTQKEKAKRVEADEQDGKLHVRDESTCIHDVAIPKGFQGAIERLKDPPYYDQKPAKSYSFALDAFQAMSITCLERGENVLVSAHTSAGKTVVAEYAIAMCFRDKQRVVYTSPLKALSNQKFRELKDEFDDVGLMTGDVTISPQATCVVMTTEILRSMLYRGDELLQSMKWVIFDEIHYMRDKERGVVWEETMIFCPPRTKMVFLSATLPNASEFASWVAHIHESPCHIVYTDFRPVPLQHYVFPPGGKGMYMVVDENGNFKEGNFQKVEQEISDHSSSKSRQETGGRRGGRGRGQGGRGEGRGGRGGKQDTGQSDVLKVVEGLKSSQLEPVIVFAFSRRECEDYAMKCHNIEFNSEKEQADVEEIFNNAVQWCLNEGDQNLRAITAMLPILKKGVGVHHSGLLPILKELVEVLFQEQLLKVLFATETFAMGLNMPARTVVFTAVRKWDGEKSRYLTSGEYVQMSGRAGRRGKDPRGVSVLMADEDLTAEDCKNIMQGEPMAIESSFRLTFYTILNLFRRSERLESTEYIISKSFHQFQHESRLPKLDAQIDELERQADEIQAVSEDDVKKYNDLKTRINEAEAELQYYITHPDVIFPFLNSGRLVRVKQKGADWGWGILVSVVRRAGEQQEQEEATDVRRMYQLDTLLPCAKGKSDSGKPQPAGQNADADMRVVPVMLSVVHSVSSLRIQLPRDLRTADQRNCVLLMLRELERRYDNKLPTLHPENDLGLGHQNFKDAYERLNTLQSELQENAVHKMQQPGDTGSLDRRSLLEKKAQLKARADELRGQRRNSELKRFQTELRNRAHVLRRLGHLDENNVITTKGKATCQIDTADELIASELMFNGAFNKIDKHQLAALCSCFVQVEKSNEQVKLKDKPELAEPLRMLQESARMIGDIENECKVEVNVDEYVQSFKPTLMDVVYHWSRGEDFDRVNQMTDVFEGSIVRAVRRLDEVLVQLCSSSNSVGDKELSTKFHAAAESLRHGIIASASLYL